MPITQGWENTKKTVYTFCMDADWTWSDYQGALRIGYEVIGAVAYQVDVIYVYLSPLPSGNAIQYLMLASESQPENCYRSVIVDPDNVVQEIIYAVDRMNQWEGPHFTMTVAEAVLYLTESDDT